MRFPKTLMGTASARSGSHPVILKTVTFGSAQATVIVVDLFNRGLPFFFFPILCLNYLCR